MATKTSGDIEREFFDNLAATTGKSLKSWFAEIASFGNNERNEIIKIEVDRADAPNIKYDRCYE